MGKLRQRAGQVAQQVHGATEVGGESRCLKSKSDTATTSRATPQDSEELPAISYRAKSLAVLPPDKYFYEHLISLKTFSLN